MNRKYRPLIAATAAVAVAAVTIFAARNDFGLGRNMEITVNMMRELSLNYVDPVDPDKLMEGAAAGMVSDLDPYTEYIPEEGMQDFELLTTGKYGGIGALIRQKEDYVRIAQPYQGSPADLAGLRIGDKILAIDGKDAKGFTTEEVSSRLKGEPGSKVRVEVEHLDGSKQTAVIRRERGGIPDLILLDQHVLRGVLGMGDFVLPHCRVIGLDLAAGLGLFVIAGRHRGDVVAPVLNRPHHGHSHQDGDGELLHCLKHDFHLPCNQKFLPLLYQRAGRK